MSDFIEKLSGIHIFRGLTPEGEEVYGALVPEGSLTLNVKPVLPPVVMWHLISKSTVNGEPHNTDVIVDPETVGISLGWYDEDGRVAYVPLEELSKAVRRLAEFERTELEPEDVAVLEAKNEVLAKENDRLREENERLHKENFWLTNGRMPDEV